MLKGGKKTLNSVKAVLLEVSFLNIYKNSPLAAEVISFMQDNIFIVYDIYTLMRRPFDNPLFHLDFLFVREDFYLRSSTRWV